MREGESSCVRKVDNVLYSELEWFRGLWDEIGMRASRFEMGASVMWFRVACRVSALFLSV